MLCSEAEKVYIDDGRREGGRRKGGESGEGCWRERRGKERPLTGGKKVRGMEKGEKRCAAGKGCELAFDRVGRLVYSF